MTIIKTKPDNVALALAKLSAQDRADAQAWAFNIEPLPRLPAAVKPAFPLARSVWARLTA